jgi:hypothetical protein
MATAAGPPKMATGTGLPKIRAMRRIRIRLKETFPALSRAAACLQVKLRPQRTK